MNVSANQIDFTDRGTQACPYAAFQCLRPSGGVYKEPTTGFYNILDYNLVKRLAADTEHLSMRAGLIGQRDGDVAEMGNAIIAENHVQMVDVLVSGDPPEHRFHRSLLDKVFTTRRVKEMEGFLTEVAERRIALFRDQGSVNLHTEFSIPVPLIVIASQLGMPVEELDLERFRGWSDAFARRSEPTATKETILEASHALRELHRHVLDKAEEYRRAPVDNLLSDLVRAEADGRTLNDDELISIVTVLLAAGNESTSGAISHAVVQMMEQPGLEDRLRADPALVPVFVEELLRHQSPVQALFRRAKADIEVDGVMIPAGSILVLRWGAANRDPEKFADPDAFDLTRPNSRQHIAFGFGAHFCIGNQLARTELRIAISKLIEQLKNIRPSDQAVAVVRDPHYSTFGFREVNIVFEPNEETV